MKIMFVVVYIFFSYLLFVREYTKGDDMIVKENKYEIYFFYYFYFLNRFFILFHNKILFLNLGLIRDHIFMSYVDDGSFYIAERSFRKNEVATPEIK